MEQICDPFKPWAPSQLPQPPGAYPNVPLLASGRTAKYYIINECCLLKPGASSCLNTIYELFSVWETRGPSLPANWLPSTPEPTKEMLVIGAHVQVWCIGVSCLSIDPNSCTVTVTVFINVVKELSKWHWKLHWPKRVALDWLLRTDSVRTHFTKILIINESILVLVSMALGLKCRWIERVRGKERERKRDRHPHMTQPL
jgi:hypothetical protein